MEEKGEDDVELFVYDGSVHPNTIIQKEKTGGVGEGCGCLIPLYWVIQYLCPIIAV